MNLGEKIKRMRLQKGLTQEELATKMSYTRKIVLTDTTTEILKLYKVHIFFLFHL